jgi:hypothetical protein
MFDHCRWRPLPLETLMQVAFGVSCLTIAVGNIDAGSVWRFMFDHCRWNSSFDFGSL